MSADASPHAGPPAPSHRTRTHAILAAGERLPQSLLAHQWDSPQVQRILFAARQRFGHALCTCRPEPLKLQVRLRGGQCHLAVWPSEHRAHARDCLYFQPPPASASAPARDGAPLSPAAGRGPAPGRFRAPRPQAPVRIALWLGASSRAPRDAVRVSVMSLAQRLWEAADLCLWHPDWTRDWSRTRYQLLRSAGRFTLNGCPLEHLLFLPRPYRPAAAPSLDREWTAFLHSLRVSRLLPPRLLVAPVCAWRAPCDDQSAAMQLRHLRRVLTLHPACWDFLARSCRDALASSRLAPAEGAGTQGVHAPTDRQPELVGFFLAEPTPRDGIRARAAWLLPVHPSTWQPAADQAAIRRIDALLEHGRAFRCGFGAPLPSGSHDSAPARAPEQAPSSS